MDGDAEDLRVNSVSYWDQRFLEDWVAKGGRQQTALFADMVCRSLPPLLADDIAARRLSIFDFGCALGDALPVLRGVFPTSALSGGDASPVAVALAHTLHPQFDFNVLGPSEAVGYLADVVYCSNTLEHFFDWRTKLDGLALRARDYVIVAVPHRERELTGEHVVTFETETLPDALGNGARLLCLQSIDTSIEPDTWWPGRQLVAVFAHAPAFERLLARGWLAVRERSGVETSIELAEAAIDPIQQLALAREEHAKAEALQFALAREQHAKAEALAADLTAQVKEQQRVIDAVSAKEGAWQAAIAEQASRFAAETRAATALAVDQAAKIEAGKKRLAEAEQLFVEREGALKAAIAEQAERLASEARTAGEREADLRIQIEAHVSRQASDAARFSELSVRLAAQETQSAERQGEIERRAQRLELELASLRAQAARRYGPLGQWRERRRSRLVDQEVTSGDRANAVRDWISAIGHYRQALSLRPDLTPTWVQLGHALKEQGDLASAETAHRKALVLDASVPDTHLQLGHLLKLQGRWDEAADAYSSALARDPRLDDAAREMDRLAPRMIAAGDAARDVQNWTLAARRYRQGLNRLPDLAPIWVQLGHALKEQGDYAGAEAAYRRALSLDEADPEIHLQLGHLMNLRARRDQAAQFYAGALRINPDFVAARESLHAIVGYSPAEFRRAFNGGNGAAAPPPSAAVSSALPAPTMLTTSDRYGAWFADAMRRRGTGRDVIWLGVIDWHFRIQRPQHLASHLADAGSRVFYVSILFEPADEKGRFRIIDSPHPGVFEIRARLGADASESIYRGLSDAVIAELQTALDELTAALDLRAPVVVTNHPSWHQVACGVPGATVVYDCLDLATGFSNVAESVAELEKALIVNADLVVAASRPLAEHLAQQRSCTVIRNAADFDCFAQAFSDRPIAERPVVGYFGAIADWFNIEWIESCAAAHPDWDFRLIGRTDGCDISRAERLSNVQFLGEQPYADLPHHLRGFDVAVIPFKMTELIRCTNPVKLYEYMAAGKPVVAAPMPEVREATDLAYIAEDAASFAARIAEALADDSLELRQKRQAWAREHTWATRAKQFAAEIGAIEPLVSVIVLTFNQWDYTKACLASLSDWSDYPNLEIIVVDNASTDATRAKLAELRQRDSRIKVILNDENLGFAGGNNVGLRAASGEYVILLNNDTVVTRGWVRDLIRPMQHDPKISLVGPVTNNIGNEQKIKLVYDNMMEMERQSRGFTRQRLRHLHKTKNLAFFCVAIRAALIEDVGLLDEAYGIGFYEDDDYCKRVLEKGYDIVIADDVFVHHHLAVSFQTLGAKAGELMARNKAIFEQRWGPWQPHRYRDEPGFG